MNYIKASEFLEQSEKIRDELLEWWLPQIGDIYCDTDAYGIDWLGVIKGAEELEEIKIDKKYYYYIPLFQMDQLMQFIQDKGYKFVSVNNYIEVDKKQMWTAKAFKTMMQLQPSFETFEEDKLKALWEVAIEIAKCQ